jgi:hypothetical protein
VSRSKLVLYRLDRPALKALSEEVLRVLTANDTAGLASLLGLDAEAVLFRPRLVDHFLVPERGDPAGLHAALRKAAKARALTPSFASDSLALEGRLRAFEPLRDDATAAAAIDKLLNPKRVPWYLRASDATAGWLEAKDAAELARRMDRLKGQLTPELKSFAQGLASIPGDVIAHDSL